MKISMISLDGIDQVTPLARELGEQGHQVTIHTRSEKPGKRRTTLAPGVVVDPIPAGPAQPLEGADLLPHLAEFGQVLAQRWAKTGPDVVHAHGWASGLAAQAASRHLDGAAVTASASPAQLAAGRRLPLLQTYAPPTSRGPQVDPAARARLERALARSAAAATVPCGQNREDLVRMGVPRTRIAVVPTGVDTTEFTQKGPIAPRGERQRVLLLTGPAGPDAHLAVRALTRLPDTELVIAGGPHPADLETDAATTRLRHLAKDLGVDDRVILLGELQPKQAARLIRSADLVLALHDHDPYGTIALQAMACGIPVLARDCGGHRDTVVDGITGVLVSDLRPASLAHHIRDLLAHPVRREALGIAAADRVHSRHTWDRIARETADLYDKIA